MPSYYFAFIAIIFVLVFTVSEKGEGGQTGSSDKILRCYLGETKIIHRRAKTEDVGQFNSSNSITLVDGGIRYSFSGLCVLQQPVTEYQLQHNVP